MAKILSTRKVYIRKPDSDFCDIDVDLSFNPITREDRHTVFQYLEKKYNSSGKNHIGLVGTRTVYSIKSALRDICRTYEIPAQETFAVTKEIDESISLSENIKRSKVLKEFIEKYHEPFKIASQIVGVTSNFGVHAGGVIISGEHYPLDSSVPVKRSESGLPATIFDKDELQNYCGFIKYDILQVTALSQITYVKYLLKEKNLYEDYPETPEPFQLCKKGHHKNIFQFESPLGKRCFKELRMESIYDLSNASGMIRQMGTAGGRAMYDKYKKNSTGTEQEWLNNLRSETSQKTFDIVMPILKRTYGILIYQEQLSEMVEKLSNKKYSFADGNAVRKKLGKMVGKYGLVDSLQGNKELLKEWHTDIMETLNKYIIPFLDEDDLNIPGVKDFIDFKLDSKNRIPIPQTGIINWFIIGSTYLFSIIHSVAYSINSFNQMYQKHFHPVEFWLSALHCGSKDDVADYISAAKSESKIKFLSPDINKSLYSFSNEDGKIRFGLGFIAGMDKAAEEILIERKNGPFKNFEDFFNRTKRYSSVNKKVIENLMFSGAFGDETNSLLESKGLSTTEENLRILEREALSVNISSPDIDLDGCSSFSSIEDGSSALCMFSILKIQDKVTKNKKPYTLLSVMDLVGEERSNVFVWTGGVKFTVGEVLKKYIKKNGDFLALDFGRR